MLNLRCLSARARAVDERDGNRMARSAERHHQDVADDFSVGGQQFIALAVGSNIVCFGL